jgi:hypothetical protein
LDRGLQRDDNWSEDVKRVVEKIPEGVKVNG